MNRFVSPGMVAALCAGLWMMSARGAAQDAEASSAGLATSEAESPPAAAPPDVVGAAVPVGEASGTPAPTDDDALWRRYHHAFEHMAAGARAQALLELEALVRDAPDHPAARRAREVLAHRGPAGGLEAPRQEGVAWPAPTSPRPRAVDDERPPVAARREDPNQRHGPTKLARAELIGLQTLMGVGYGVEACVLINCRGARPWTFAPVAGAGLTLTLSVLGTRHGIRPATAVAVNMGSLWGVFHGYALTAALGDFYSDYGDPGMDMGDEMALAMFFSQLGGAGLGYLLDRRLEPTAGDVSLAGSGALWSTVAAVYLGLTFRPNSFGRHVRYLHWGLLAAADLGMVLGGLLARAEPMSRGRVMLIDVGAAVGLGLGTGLAFLLGGDNVSPSAVFGTGTLGLVGGGALAFWLTRAWDAPDVPVQVGLLPTRGGAGLTLGGRF